MTKLCIIFIYTNLHSPEQLHIVRYKTLKENLGSEMKLIMDFLGLKFDKGSLISEGFCYKVRSRQRDPKPIIQHWRFGKSGQ